MVFLQFPKAYDIAIALLPDALPSGVRNIDCLREILAGFLTVAHQESRLAAAMLAGTEFGEVWRIWRYSANASSMGYSAIVDADDKGRED